MTTLPVADIIEWDVLNWSQLIRYWSPIVEKLAPNSNVLAIGERNGGLSTWLGLLGHNVVCTDREFPTGKAQLEHQRLGLADRITYASLDIVNCNWQPDMFDVVISKSVIGGLKANPADRTTRSFEVQQRAVNNVYRLLKDTGYFLSAENMQGAGIIQQYRKKKQKGNGWRYLNWPELDSLYSQFSVKQLDSFGVFPTNFSSGFVNQACYLANRYILTILPREYKYISFVVAQKVSK